MPVLSRRLFASSIARFTLAGLLVANFAFAASVAFADLNDSGTDVGAWCYEDNKGQPDYEVDLAACINNLCSNRSTPELVQECKDKANKEAKKRAALGVDDHDTPDDPIPEPGDPNA